METFYPKFGEVELVIVEDNNDFFDPLESNYECEDENEDVKLQLNDNVYEENQFQIDIDDLSSESHTELDSPQNARVKQEVPEQSYNYVNYSKQNLKWEKPHEISDDSVDAEEAHFQDNDSDHSLEIPSYDGKSNVEGISEVKKVARNCQEDGFENKSADNKSTEKHSQKIVSEVVKPTKTKLEPERDEKKEKEKGAKATTSKTGIKNRKNKVPNVCKAKRKRLKDDGVIYRNIKLIFVLNHHERPFFFY